MGRGHPRCRRHSPIGGAATGRAHQEKILPVSSGVKIKGAAFIHAAPGMVCISVASVAIARAG